MRVPTLHYRKANESEDKGFAPYVTGIIGAGALISALVWALVIAKLIDFHRMH
jgi:Tfp pilus assembly protein PilN